MRPPLVGLPPVVRAGPQAAALLAALHAEAFPPGERWDAAAMDVLLAMPGTFAGVARCGAEAPGGFVMGRVAADEAEILTLAVRGEARRQGLGRALLAWLRTEAASHGARRLFLEVSAGNVAARALYRAAGFAEAGRRRAYYPDGSDAFVLAAALDDPEP
ncbi:ribosomal protein alanine acetyltransferase [Gluconacetobacter johannae DSM 13595]|uniref:Ribosomal protein S18-alanine N-acetyltransferase n=1 Tax=Gluconacetobacter johannae TaxID=112140 RepID=A0A7W4J510_9PROT|nr:ribosomal protein S18-alanine N-acetyltransferase [Gluconacetobacter johannae]MBB2174766.1 ribosomal protein S18-alanine N-acetyltransferase [Gluconacetobacter johannae]GBQ80441.1 ribosomal protein alanine acetyltransferase [Gluconacetobacter johannae DSM 13595]